MFTKNKLLIFIVVLSCILSSPIFAQELFSSQDLSNLKVNTLSDENIEKIKEYLKSNNMTIEQAEPLLLAKGMSAGEFANLKNRLSTSSPPTGVPSAGVSSAEIPNIDLREQQLYTNNKDKNDNNEVFGSELFDNPKLNFEPNLNLPTPMNYVLGPGDELQVSVYGVQEFNTTTAVSVEGKLSIQNVGQIAVSGLTIEAATQKIRKAIARIFSTVASGQSQVSVSLSRIRTIKVTLIGAVQPGNYSISSLATVYNALYLGGGPNKKGSYRNIELIRNNKVYKYIDIYRFLVNGDQSDNIGLRDNDVIRIPAYNNRVRLEGEVKRPGVFEMKPGESFSDLLRFASGFTDAAYTASVNIVQKTDKEYKIKTIKFNEFSNYIPFSGDVIKISTILNRFENRITIEGAVFRPDTYSFSEGMRISDLITQADGLKEDAYKLRARIVRLKEDLTTEIVNVDIDKALAGDSIANILLKREDVLKVYSILEFEESFTVNISGEIRNPGSYKFVDNLSLNDLIIQAGGLTDAASKRVEISRLIKEEKENINNPNSVEFFNFEINTETNEQVNNFQLKPFDLVSIRRLGIYEKPNMVIVSGAVNYEGSFVLVKKREKIYDIIERAGGLRTTADINAVKIIRANGVLIPIDWKKVVKNPKSKSNITLEAGDQIKVDFLSELVKVTGGVLLTSEIPFSKGRGFKYYINSVGGTNEKAWKKKSYILYPNGVTATTKNFLFFRNHPKVFAGSQIVIPQKPEHKKMETTEMVSIATIISSLTLIILTALKQ